MKQHFTVLSVLIISAATAKEPIPWQVAGDAHELPAVPATASSLIKSPKYTADLLAPTSPSPWVLTGWMEGYQDHRIQLHNLVTGKSTGPVKVKKDIYTYSRLSPDGKKLIGRHSVSGGWTIGAWDTKNGRLLWQDTQGGGVLPWNDFVDDKRIIEVSGGYMKVWNIVTKRLEHHIKPVDGLAVSGSIFTPNRRFLARLETGGIARFYEMPGGKPAGELQPPNLGGRQVKAGRMDISSDGKELAAILLLSKEKGTIDDRWLMASWNLGNGKLISQHELPRDLVASLNPFSRDFDVDCLPDHSGWLFRNAGILERDSAKLVWVVPRGKGLQGVSQPSLFLSGNRLAFRAAGIRDGEAMLRIVSLPNDMDTRIKAIKAGKPVPGLKEALASPTNPLGGTDWAVVRQRTDALKAIPPSKRKPLSPAELDRCVKEVAATDTETSNRALERLGSAAPDPAQATQVVEAIQAVATRGKNPFYATAGWWVISQWRSAATAGTTTGGHPPSENKGAATGIEAELNSGDFTRIVRAMQELAGRKDSEAAELLVRHYTKNRALAGSGLRKMGPVAAPALTQLLKSPDFAARIMSLDLLKQYGTEKELPALKALQNDSNRLVQMKAAEAIKGIEER